MDLPYDQTDPRSIERHGKRLIDHSLRETSGAKEIPEKYLEQGHTQYTKGVFGHLLERYYYGIEPGNESQPDFKEAGVELKSTPVKKLRNKKFSAKERLVLNLINYKKEAEKTFETSSFLYKNKILMLIGYLHDSEKSVVDLLIKFADLLDYDNFSEEDKEIIRSDWEKIVAKIRAGRAHELSEGDTFYLGACTKAANKKIRREQVGDAPRAKPRAFSYKSGYMTSVIRGLLDAEPVVKDVKELKERDLEDAILERFQPYIGKTTIEIHEEVGEGLNRGAKNYYALLAQRIMGVKKKRVAEFEKANIKMKTIRVKKDGMPKEDMSFPTFKYMELIEEKWIADEEFGEGGAQIRQELEQKFFLVVYECEERCEGGEELRLKKVMFWNMPQEHLERDVRWVWEETKKRIKEGRADDLPKKSDNPVCHVRPHARNREDTYDTLLNGPQVKKCFWLDKRYIKQIIS